jgi:hypothetical protein
MPKPKLRSFQFSLRSLFLIMTAIVVFLGIHLHPARRQSRAIGALEKVGAELTMERADDLGFFRSVWLRVFVNEEDCVNVTECRLAAPVAITDADLRHLNGLTELEDLRLYHVEVTDAGLEHLKGLTKLKHLQLAGLKATDSTAEYLKGLSNLQELELDRLQMTDAAMEQLKGLTNLQYLWIYDIPITDAGLEHLKGLPKLEYLNI